MRLIFLTCVISWLAGAQALAADVLGVAADAREGGARLTIELADAQPFKAFALANPARLVIDLPDAAWRGEPFDGPKAGVTRLRHGAFRPGVYRLVFDLDAEGKISAKKIVKTDDSVRLLIDIAYSPDLAAAPQPWSPFQAVADPKPEAAAAPGPAPPSPPAAETPATTASPPPAPPRRPPVRTVMLDAGHGGADPGAIGKGGVIEKKVVLAVARTVKKLLETDARYKVVMTRDRDIFLRLRERVRRGREAKADLFVSIHADSHPNAGVSGASLYTLSETASDAEAARLARAENKADLIGGVELEDEPQEVYDILLDLAQRETKNQSSAAADDLLFALAANQPLLRRPKRSAGFAVLKAPDVPSVLIELGFLSNPTDAKRLGKPEGRDRIAAAIAEGVRRYFDGANTARGQAHGKQTEAVPGKPG